MNITHTIVNTNRQLIGFVINNDGNMSAVTINDLKNSKFSNRQIGFNENGMLFEKGDFKLNKLPMKVVVNNSYVDISNSIELVERIVCDNENIGFACKFADGSTTNMRYNDIITMSHWFKPVNFSVRASASGKKFIAGKNGTVLDELNAIYVDKGQTTKRTKPAAKEVSDGLNTKMQQDIDIVDIFNIVRKLGGYIIKLPSEEYHVTTENKYVDKTFKSLNLGEVASPYLNINPEKINVYANFKKLGKVDINGTELITFKNTNKCIFDRNVNHIKNFAVAIEQTKAPEFIQVVGKTLALEQIIDADFINVMNHVVNSQSMQYLKINTSKVEIMSISKRNGAVLNGDELYKLVNNIYELKIVRKAFDARGKYMKDLKSYFSPDAWAQMNGKELFYAFKNYTPEQLKVLQENGIDIYTGGYVVKGEYKGPSEKTDNTAFTEKPLEIKYSIQGKNIDKISASDIQLYVHNNDPKLGIGKEYIDMLSHVYSLGNPSEILSSIKEINRKINEMLYYANMKLWMHEIAMLEYGDYKKIHQNDKKFWQVSEESRTRNYETIQYLDTPLLCSFVGLSF